MATKAQETKNAELVARRSRAPTKRARPKRNDATDTSLPGVTAADRKAGGGHTGLRNISRRAASKAVAAFEDSTTDRPSRKSTRRSAAHIKAGTQLERRQQRRVTSPKARATRASAKKAK